MSVVSFNSMRRKSNGHISHKNGLVIRLLLWCLFSAVIVCANTSSSTPTTNTANSSSTNTTNSTSTNTANSTSTNTANSTSTNTANSTSTNTADTTSTNTANSTSTNTANTTSTKTANTPTTNITSIPTTNITSAPTATNTSTPAAKVTSTPAAKVTSTLNATITGTPAAKVTSNLTATITSTPAAKVTTTSAAKVTSTPAAKVTTTSAAKVTSTPAAKVTTTSAAKVTTKSAAKVTISSTSGTTIIPTTRKGLPSFPMRTESLNVKLQLQVKVTYGEYNDSLKDPDSGYYQAMVSNVTNDLTPAFNKTNGFVNITITGFWNGSVGVNFTSYYKDADISDLYDSLLKGVTNNLNRSLVQADAPEQTLNKSIANELKNVCEQSSSCPNDYICVVSNDLQLVCEHLCHNHEREIKCQNNGYCVVDTIMNQPVCRCPENDDHVYGGEHCEQKTEKLDMSKDKIIAIAVGVGGGVILLLIIAIFVICLRQRLKKLSKENNIIDNASEQSFQSFKGSEDQPVSNQATAATSGQGYSLYRLPEERAENPKFNPYLSLPSVQQPAGRQLDLSEGFPSAGTRESSRNITAKTQQFQERVPNYGDPVHIPRFKVDPTGSDYVTTHNKPSKSSSLPKPTNSVTDNRRGFPLHSTAEAKVYDYSQDVELVASGTAHPLNDTDLYDFSYENQPSEYARHRNGPHAYDFPYENDAKQRNGINDPYSVKRRLM